MNYIYTCNGASATNAANDALMFPANRVSRIDGVSATTTQIYIEAHDGTADCDEITITHASLKNKEVTAAVVKMLQMQNKDGFVVMSGFDTLTDEFFPINNLDTTIAVTDIVGTQS